MNVYILVENSTEFMSHDVTEFVIASTNKQKLMSIKYHCEILSQGSVFSIFRIENVSNQRLVVKYHREHTSDWNYCHTEDREPFFDDSDFVKADGVRMAELPILRSVTEKDLDCVYAYKSLFYRDVIIEHRRIKKLTRSGRLWQEKRIGK